MISVYEILIRPEEKELLGRPRHKWENNMVYVDWIDVRIRSISGLS
jgi:hypothetical protein